MVKEPKNVDFYTTGRQPSEQDFARISEWIKKDKQKQLPAAPDAMPIKESEIASESLREGYQSDQERTTATKPGDEPVQAAASRTGDTVNPELAGKYDNEPFFQEKVNRANEILKTAGVPKFPERPK